MSPATVQHLPMVGLTPPSKEVQSAQKAHSNGLQSLESLDLNDLIERARVAAGLTHGQVCAYIGNGKGKAYDQSQWTTARETGNLPLGRMLALPAPFWHHFIVGLSEAAGLHVSHADMADIAVQRVAVAFEAVAEAFRHMRRAG